MTGPMTHRLLLVATVVAAIVGSMAAPSSEDAAAASPGLTIINHRRDTKTREFYYDRAYLAVQPGTTGFKVSSATGNPSVSVAAKRKDHTLLRIDFGKRLNAGATRTVTLAFNIVDKGGSPTRDIRIGTSLVSFAAWAFASDSTPGGSVTVTWPAGYNIEVESPEL